MWSAQALNAMTFLGGSNSIARGKTATHGCSLLIARRRRRTKSCQCTGCAHGMSFRIPQLLRQLWAAAPGFIVSDRRPPSRGSTRTLRRGSIRVFRNVFASSHTLGTHAHSCDLPGLGLIPTTAQAACQRVGSGDSPWKRRRRRRTKQAHDHLDDDQPDHDPLQPRRMEIVLHKKPAAEPQLARLLCSNGSCGTASAPFGARCAPVTGLQALGLTSGSLAASKGCEFLFCSAFSHNEKKSSFTKNIKLTW